MVAGDKPVFRNADNNFMELFGIESNIIANIAGKKYKIIILIVEKREAFEQLSGEAANAVLQSPKID